MINHFDPTFAALLEIDTAAATLRINLALLDCDSSGILAVLGGRIGEARVEIVEDSLAWLDEHFEDPAARPLLANIRRAVAGAQLGEDCARSAAMRKAERLN
jgi:hypothetical protein